MVAGLDSILYYFLLKFGALLSKSSGHTGWRQKSKTSMFGGVSTYSACNEMLTMQLTWCNSIEIFKHKILLDAEIDKSRGLKNVRCLT